MVSGHRMLSRFVTEEKGPEHRGQMHRDQTHYSHAIWGAVVMEEVALSQALKDKDLGRGAGVADRRRA